MKAVGKEDAEASGKEVNDGGSSEGLQDDRETSEK